MSYQKLVQVTLIHLSTFILGIVFSYCFRGPSRPLLLLIVNKITHKLQKTIYIMSSAKLIIIEF